MADWLQPALRFVLYAALLELFGWTALRVVGLRGLPALPRVGNRTAVLATAVAAPVPSVALMLALIAAMMGLPVAALDWPMVEAMTFSTAIG